MALFGKRNIENPTYPLSGAVAALGPAFKSASGRTVTPESSIGVMAVWRAVSLLAGVGSSLPVRVHRHTRDQGKLPVRVPWLEQPNPRMTALEFFELVWVHLLLWGNHYSAIERSGAGAVLSLSPLHPYRVEPKLNRDGTKVYVVNGTTTLTDESIWHVPGIGYDGIKGLSPIMAARQALGVAVASEEAAAKLYGSGMLQSGFLRAEEDLTSDQAEEIKQRFRAHSLGIDNAYDLAIASSGLEWVSVGIPAQDAQFIESRRFQVAEVARLFGVPPHLLMDATSSTSWGAGIQEQTLGFLTFTMRPYLRKIERRIDTLLPKSLAAEFLVEELLRARTQDRYAVYEIALRNRILTRNRVRELEGEPPVEGGDVFDEFAATGASSPSGGEEEKESTSE